MSEAAKMAALTGLYKTTNLVVPLSGTPNELVLKPNPTRLYVRFRWFAPLPVNASIYPGPAVDLGALQLPTPLDDEVKWKDAPSVVAGDWYYSGGAVAVVLVTTCDYVGA